MEIALISEEILEVLRESGWSENRKVSVSSWLTKLENDGYTVFPYAIEVLEELGSLQIRTKPKGSLSGVTIDFNALDSGLGESDRLESFEKYAGEILFPLGLLYDFFVYVGPSKNIYIGCWAEFSLVANGIEAFINSIFSKESNRKIIYNAHEI